MPRPALAMFAPLLILASDASGAQPEVPPLTTSPDAWSLRNDRPIRIYAAQSLELEQGERGQVREHQSPDRWADARQGAAGRPPPPAALFTGHTERCEGHGDAGGAAGARPSRRGIRCVVDPDRRQSVRQRLRGGQPELQDTGADGSQWAGADPGVRIRRDPVASR